MGKEEITAIEHKLIAATSTDEFMAFMDEATVRYDYLPPLQYVGGPAVRANLALFFDNAKNAKGKFVSLDVTADEQLGIAYSLMYFTWTGPDGKPAEATFRVTHCFHKAKGEWKIFHSHVSFPINPATGQAEMNLKE
ncbi:MAG: YybH family protein [Candidatus Binatia bacterium]